jgi:hypothetical protein
MAMTTYETKLRGARNRLVVALGEAKEPEAIGALESILGTLNRLINPQEAPVMAEAD